MELKNCVSLYKTKKNMFFTTGNLKQYLDLGLKLKKVHKVLQFDQSVWLKPYIDLNTNLRRQASCKFDEARYLKI